MLSASIACGALNLVGNVLFMQRLHWELNEYAWLGGGFGLAAGAVGSSIGGTLGDLLGHRRLAAIGSLVMAAGWLAFALGEPWWNERAFVYPLAMIEPFATGIMLVSLWSVCMSMSLKRTAATQFALYTSLTSVSMIIGSRLIGPFAIARWKLPTIYIAAAAYQVATIAVLYFIDLGQVRRELGDT
jgi:MFS family permease